MPSDPQAPLTLLGIPVRVDSTLCEPDEIWLENPNGEAVRVHPPCDDLPEDPPDQP